ncbi:hypothetical protein GCM10010260_45380 [Streptomyces filipinensis]|uniref:Uncharacterized protein n=1 Tax=Streptomyces filipinensis TaxID=66887 RepID=A0A918MBW7_9ACTN|nr:hypothetical protein [Streptomyces filipinensis]GGV03532.1 hypothetical protein GCM10010260_45380 [Streptomyces filipinensis]
MRLSRALPALFALGLALGMPATAAADALAAGPPAKLHRHHCYTPDQARTELDRRAAAAVKSGKKGRVRVPVCENSGTSRCDAPNHRLLCGQWCRDCDGLVCSQPWFSEYQCGSC